MYNAAIDLMIFGLFFIGIGLVIFFTERKPKRGAVPDTDVNILMHQRIRAIENDLL